jgi:FdhD protein
MSRQVPVHRWSDAGPAPANDWVAEEEPLEILIESSFKGRRETNAWGITLRTPGNDEELVIGLLYAEAAISSVADVLSVEPLGGGQIRVSLSDQVDTLLRRGRIATAACGLCGAEHLPGGEPLSELRFRIDYSALMKLPQTLAEFQKGFAQTGGLHAAAFFDASGRIVAAREDIGRHNAVDKLIGYGLRHMPSTLSGHGILLSGRAGYELIHKAGRAGIPFVAAIGAPTSLSVETARRCNQTLAGFLRPGKVVLYSGNWRLQKLPAAF